jgi:hypothetical protein
VFCKRIEHYLSLYCIAEHRLLSYIEATSNLIVNISIYISTNKNQKMKKIICTAVIGMLIFSACSEVELANETPTARECPSTHSLVGRTSDFFENSLYGISGEVTIVSDCEIEISNFFYNGTGPNVSIYGGLNGNYRDGISLSDAINGTRFSGETLNLFLPEGTTFDEINSFSVWCFEFDVDFSSANF